MSDWLWDELVHQAKRQGVSGGEYIREAVIARIFYEYGREHEPRMARALDLARLPETKK